MPFILRVSRFGAFRMLSKFCLGSYIIFSPLCDDGELSTPLFA
nr:MAG TPA: hypothetical protein [Caudoviricetes sp.]